MLVGWRVIFPEDKLKKNSDIIDKNLTIKCVSSMHMFGNLVELIWLPKMLLYI